MRLRSQVLLVQGCRRGMEGGVVGSGYRVVDIVGVQVTAGRLKRSVGLREQLARSFLHSVIPSSRTLLRSGQSPFSYSSSEVTTGDT